MLAAAAKAGAVVFLVLLLASCSGGGSTSASTSSGTANQPSSSSRSSSSGSISGSSGSGAAAFNPQGCTAPSADQIGTAFGAPVTKTTPTADTGCLWETAPSQGVQVSYHSPDDFNATRLAVLKAGSTPVSVRGAKDAFVKRLALPNGTTNDVEYVVFDNGTVQIAFTAPTAFLTEQNEGAVTKAIVG